MISRFYRYELSFHGEPQNVGILNGLEDIGLPIDLECALYELFEELESPTLHPDGKTIEFWFTEKGQALFGTAIGAIADAIAPYGWELISRKKVALADDAIYQDEYQAAWFV